MLKHNNSANLVRTIETLYDKTTSAVQMNGNMGELFRTTVGGKDVFCHPPSSTFSRTDHVDALDEHEGKVSIDGRNITNRRFADDIDAVAEKEQELEALAESLDKACTRYKWRSVPRGPD